VNRTLSRAASGFVTLASVATLTPIAGYAGEINTDEPLAKLHMMWVFLTLNHYM
jgi:hypothetical protein